MELVVDASVAIVWALDDEEHPIADAALTEIRQTPPVVPAIWWHEVANVLVINERRCRITPAETDLFLGRMARAKIEIDPLPDTANIISLARIHRLTVYDAAYLELAQRRGARLATLDRALSRAAEAEGVGLFIP
jgi:predicted nucleic acid-binding protein